MRIALLSLTILQAIPVSQAFAKGCHGCIAEKPALFAFDESSSRTIWTHVGENAAERPTASQPRAATPVTDPVVYIRVKMKHLARPRLEDIEAFEKRLANTERVPSSDHGRARAEQVKQILTLSHAILSADGAEARSRSLRAALDYAVSLTDDESTEIPFVDERRYIDFLSRVVDMVEPDAPYERLVRLMFHRIDLNRGWDGHAESEKAMVALNESGALDTPAAQPFRDGAFQVLRSLWQGDYGRLTPAGMIGEEAPDAYVRMIFAIR